METLVVLQLKDAPAHPALPRAERYDVRALRFLWGDDNAVLEIEVSTHEDYAVLRLEGVEDLCIPCGNILTSIRLKIQDTSKCPSRTHAILPIRVGGVVDEGCSLRFWAQSVQRLTNNENGR